MSRFSETLMEHFQYPVNRAAVKSPNVIGKGSLDGYPPFVSLYLQLEGDRVIRATFEAQGCGVTIACGSMLTEMVTGRTLAECRQLSAHDLNSALDGVPADKQYCVNVAISTLQDALESADDRDVGMVGDSPNI